MSEVEQKKAQAKELLTTIRPLLQQKIEKLLTSRVEKLLVTVQNQDVKIQKITEVLQTIYQMKGGVGQRPIQARRTDGMDNKELILRRSEEGVQRGLTNDNQTQQSDHHGSIQSTMLPGFKTRDKKDGAGNVR